MWDVQMISEPPRTPSSSETGACDECSSVFAAEKPVLKEKPDQEPLVDFCIPDGRDNPFVRRQ